MRALVTDKCYKVLFFIFFIVFHSFIYQPDGHVFFIANSVIGLDGSLFLKLYSKLICMLAKPNDLISLNYKSDSNRPCVPAVVA